MIKFCCEEFRLLCRASFNPDYDAQSVHIYHDGKVKRASYYYEGGGTESDENDLDFKLCPYCGAKLE